MAIAFDATSSGFTGSGTSLTFSHTCTGADRILFVGIMGAVDNDYVTGVTYNGVAMTLVTKTLESSGSYYDYLFYLINPDSGANSVVISASPSSFIAACSISYTGASQSAQPDNSTTYASGGAATSHTISLTTVADNCWIMLTGIQHASFPTAGAGTTKRIGNPSTGSPVIFDSNAAKTPAGSTSLVVNLSSSDNFGAIIASFAPALPSTIKTINGLAIASVKSINGVI